MASVWRCQECGATRNEVSPSLHPRYGMGYCLGCRHERLFKLHEEPIGANHGQARRTDPPTSQEAAERIRPKSARWQLLAAHLADPDGLTDEEAADSAGLSLRSEYATRCSELMRAGYLRDTEATRTGASGMKRQVRVITEQGRAWFNRDARGAA